jgi:protein-tyrosine phosphatase
MIWQETGDVAVIVMLTQTHDGFMEKCYQYFPPSAEAAAYYVEPIDKENNGPEGSVTFQETVSDPGSKTEIRRLSLRFGDETKEIWHFLYAGWPDFAVPEDEDRAALLGLVKHSAERNSSPSNPRIIHCSAGVGRSGTFIALEYLLAQIESGAMADAKEGEDLIYDVVNRLREQRMLMVQMDIQYEFLYDVIKEQFIEWQRQLALQTASTQHSPKLRKLASGIKSAISGKGNNEGDGYFVNEETNGVHRGDESQSEDAKTTRSRGESQVEERRREGQDPRVK